MVWYVDDNTVSHEDPEVVDKVIGLMKRYFGGLTVSGGDKHSFLGMNIITNKRKKIEV